MKNAPLRKIYVFFSSVLIFMLHLPFSFAKPKDKFARPARVNTAEVANVSAGTAATAETAKMKMECAMIYDSLKLNVLGLSQQAYQYAIDGLWKLKQAGKIANANLVSIVDFTKSSGQKRLFVIDLENHRLLFNTYVAHGQNSGSEFASRFSNLPESYQSSLGFYQTSTTYVGKNGYSMHLSGLEKGVNDKAEERAIVMHGAPYVNEALIKTKGFIGRSWGCPAVSEKLNRPIIDKIKNGTCFFIYSPDSRYLKNSRILNS